MKYSEIIFGGFIVAAIIALVLNVDAYHRDIKKERVIVFYPIALKSAECSTFKGDVYVMKKSYGFAERLLEVSTGGYIELGTDCTYRTLRTFPDHGNHRVAPLGEFTEEQIELMKETEA